MMMLSFPELHSRAAQCASEPMELLEQKAEFYRARVARLINRNAPRFVRDTARYNQMIYEAAMLMRQWSVPRSK